MLLLKEVISIKKSIIDNKMALTFYNIQHD